MAKKHKSRKLTDEEFQAVKENQQRRVDAAFDTFADMLIDKIKNQKMVWWCGRCGRFLKLLCVHIHIHVREKV